MATRGQNPLDAGWAVASMTCTDFPASLMLKLLALLFILVSACVAIHGLGTVFGMRWLRRISDDHGGHFSLTAMFWILIRVVYGMLLLHVLQILVWAACYHWNGCFPNFTGSFYYSATSYSTVGYGDMNPAGNWRLVGAIEAVTGVLMFGWSTGVLFTVVSHLLDHSGKDRHPGGKRI